MCGALKSCLLWYRLQGAGILQIGEPLDSALVDVRRGSHRVSVDTSAEGAVILQVLPGAGLTFDKGFDLNGHVLTKLGAGSLLLAVLTTCLAMTRPRSYR